jgi:hypothetical protein
MVGARKRGSPAGHSAAWGIRGVLQGAEGVEVLSMAGTQRSCCGTCTRRWPRPSPVERAGGSRHTRAALAHHTAGRRGTCAERGPSPPSPHRACAQVVSRNGTGGTRRVAMMCTLQIFVGHDNALFGLLTAIGLVNASWPAFGATLSFELWALTALPSAYACAACTCAACSIRRAPVKSTQRAARGMLRATCGALHATCNARAARARSHAECRACAAAMSHAAHTR